MIMQSMRYQQQVIGYHGCDRSIRDRILLGKEKLRQSSNDYDWLGKGIYFWEQGPERAEDWAEQQHRRGLIAEPSVLGAHIHLGNCFDLLDVRHTRILRDAFVEFDRAMRSAGNPIPSNKPLGSFDSDRLLRRLDCAMINWTLDQMEKGGKGSWDTARGVFQEGGAVFPESLILEKSHIQIAVRNPACILGYFRPD